MLVHFSDIVINLFYRIFYANPICLQYKAIFYRGGINIVNLKLALQLVTFLR